MRNTFANSRIVVYWGDCRTKRKPGETGEAHGRRRMGIAGKLALTMGDPSGIGPEITLKALSKYSRDLENIVVVGDRRIIERAAGYVRSAPSIRSIQAVSEAKPEAVNVLDLKNIAPSDAPPGRITAEGGKASYEYVLRAIDLAKSGAVDGVVTNPINKAALKEAGIPYPGHTEIFAHETSTTRYSMMFYLDGIAVVHVTTHCSLREALDLISTSRVLNNIELLHDTLRKMGVQKPRIAVSGVNPHAGEGGLFGSEEIDTIAPGISQAQYLGIDAGGPYPPDTVFMRAFRGEFDGIVSMLHDHGFVALKSKDFERGVNITIGLPIVRTSVGHGTAYDIAGTGTASDQSLREAIRLAGILANNP